jgi:hypothetical protein
MPVAFVISEEWMLRAGLRAELRERGIQALGMESASDVGQAIAGGEMPTVVVLDGNAKAASDPQIRQLVGRVPAVVIAPRTASIALGSAAKVLFRPVQISEIVAAVIHLVKGRNA